MSIKKDYEMWLFFLSAFIGGSFGCYAIVRYGVFSSAQTMNILTLLLSLFGRNLTEFLFRVLIMAVYAMGVVVGVLIPKYTKLNVKLVSICVTAVSAIVLAIMPTEYAGDLIGIPIFFAMALQWGSFPGARGYIATSIFLTNNFRESITGLTNYICTREKAYLMHFLFYFTTILSYAIGCVVAYYVTMFLGFRAIIYVIAPIILMFIFIIAEKRAKIEK